jgi:hypothetical protein
MSVYVDALRPTVPNRNWKFLEGCHMFADTPEELHEFALQIGMKRCWAQGGRGKLVHYDLTKAKREKAIMHGALFADRRLTGEYIRKARESYNANSGSGSPVR